MKFCNISRKETRFSLQCSLVEVGEEALKLRFFILFLLGGGLGLRFLLLLGEAFVIVMCCSWPASASASARQLELKLRGIMIIAVLVSVQLQPLFSWQKKVWKLDTTSSSTIRCHFTCLSLCLDLSLAFKKLNKQNNYSMFEIWDRWFPCFHKDNVDHNN